MHSVLFIITPSLMAMALAQQVTNAPDLLPNLYKIPQYTPLTTITMPGPSGVSTMFECKVDVEADGNVDEVDLEFECTAIGEVSSPTSVSSSRSAQKLSPRSVLEKRMQRKFGVKARQDEFQDAPTTTLTSSCEPCSTVTITSTASAASSLELCSPLPTPALNNGVLPAPAAQITAMSIVADVLSTELAAEAQAQAQAQEAAKIIPAILSALTPNLTTSIAPGARPLRNTSASNASVAAPTLTATASSGILSPPAIQAKSVGTSIAVGILANLVAAAGVAYLLV